MVDQATYQQLRRECRELKRDLDDTAHDLRKSDRENKDQSRELRDLKKENAELLETLRSRLEAGAKHKEETDRLYEHMDIMENNIMHLRQELHKRRNLMESLTLQTREANEDKADAELTARKLMKQNRDLNENLTECKDDLLRLQPPTQISDSELAEQYSNLHQQISRWVDDETEDSQQMEQRFEDFSTTNEEPSELLRKYLGSEHFRLGKKHPSSQPLILRYIIQSHLDQYIFRDDIHIFGLSPQYTTLLRGIEQGMRMLEPQRGSHRSHLLAAKMTNINRCHHNQSLEIRDPARSVQNVRFQRRAMQASHGYFAIALRRVVLSHPQHRCTKGRLGSNP